MQVTTNQKGGTTMKYIAYGSNMVEEQMAYRCPEARLIGTGYIEGARLEFYLHATVEHTALKSDRVPVAVWEINQRNERSLDRYEGYPNYYVKEEWTVTMADGSQIEGMVYVMNMIRQSPPTATYYNGIRAAYRALGLSSQIKKILEPALARSIARGQC